MYRITRKDFAILVGNTLDHFDSALYSFLVPILAPLFFPKFDPVVQLILGYSFLASSLFTKPLGALVFGSIAQKYGPMQGLSYTLVGMAIASLAMGCLPDHATIGWLAPAGLLGLKMLQGLCNAGENAIARLYIVEGKPPQQALKASSWFGISTMLGLLLASGVSALVLHSPAYHKYWRVAFWLGSCTGIAGYLLRCYQAAEEKNKAQQANYTHRAFTLSSLWKHKATFLRIIPAFGLSYMTYYIPFVFMNTFIPLITTITTADMMKLSTAFLIVDTLLFPITTHCIKKCKITKAMLIVTLGLASTIMPLWYRLPGASLFYVSLVRLFIVVCGVAYAILINVWCKNVLQDSPAKYTIVGLGQAFGGAIVGKASPAICLYLWHSTKQPLAIAGYIALCAVLAAWAILSQDQATPRDKSTA